MNEFLTDANTVAETWWRWVAAGAWQSALVGGVILLIVTAGRRWSAPVRYGLLLVALVKFAVPPLWSAPTGIISRVAPAYTSGPTLAETAAAPIVTVSEPDPIRHTEPVTAPPDELPGPTDTVESTPVVSFAGEPVERHSATAPDSIAGSFDVSSVSPANSPTRPSAPMVQPTWQSLLMLLHLFGCLIVVAFIARELLRLSGLVRNASAADEALRAELDRLTEQIGFRRPVRLLVSAGADSPIAFGTIKPTIVLPTHVTTWRRADRTTVLGHELAHLKRGDGWVNWIQLGLLAVWWFHPVFWVVTKKVRRLREDCCDDVLLASGLTSRAAYCATLLRVASDNPGVPSPIACSMASRLHPLADRLRRIMDPSVRRTVRLSILNATVLCVVAALTLPGLRSHGATSAAPNDPTPNSTWPTDPQDDDGPVDRFASRNYTFEFQRLEVAGTCKNAEGQPVPGAKIIMCQVNARADRYIDARGRRMELPPILATTTSVDDGTFRFVVERFPIRHFKPGPDAAAPEGRFALIATAEDHAFTWRGEQIVHTTPRPEFIDPDQQGRSWFPGEPIRLDLRFDEAVTIHGVATNDAGTPLPGVRVQLGLVNSDRDLVGQEPRMWSFRSTDPARAKERSPGYALTLLPPEFRTATTGPKGRYAIHGVPPNIEALFFADHQRTTRPLSGRLATQDGEDGRGRVFVGREGRYDLKFERPRVVTVTLNDAGGLFTVRARATGNRSRYRYLREGTVARTDLNGVARLQVPPGDYEIAIEPGPSTPYVRSTHAFTVHPEPIRQAVTLEPVPGVAVAIRAMKAGTNKPIEGVGFSRKTASGGTEVLHSQSVYADHPRTDNVGILRAVLPVGTHTLLPTVRPDGVEPTANSGEVTVKVSSGQRPVIRFEFLQNEPEAGVSEAGEELQRLDELWQNQRRSAETASYLVRGNNFLRADVGEPEFNAVLDSLEDATPRELIRILQGTFPDMRLGKSLNVVDGNRIAVGYVADEDGYKWRGVSVHTLNMTNGVEQLSYSPPNHQLDIHNLRNSRLHIRSLDELIEIPYRLLDGVRGQQLDVSREDGRIAIAPQGGQGRAAIVVDEKTGFLYRSFRSFGGSGREIRQYRPVEVQPGVVIPSVRIDADYRGGRLSRAELVIIDEVKLFNDLPPDTFAFAAPTGTNVLDYRDVDPRDAQRRARTTMTYSPVADVVQLANRNRHTTNSRAKRPRPASLKLGSMRPKFEVAGWYGLDGKSVDTPDFKDKVIVLSFRDSVAPYRDENRILRSALERTKDQPVEFVTIYRSNIDPKDAAAYASKYRIPWKIAIDKPGTKPRSRGLTFEAFKVYRTPTTMVIGSNGAVMRSLTHTEQTKDAISTLQRIVPAK